MSTFEKQKKKAAKPMLWVSMASMSMVFAGLTSAFVVRKAEGNWLDFDYPTAFYISTLFIIFSSISIHFVKKKVRANQFSQAKLFMLLTFLLGVSFAISQYLGWNDLYQRGIYFTGPGSNASGSFVYIITLLHLVHLIAGLLVLLFTGVKLSKNKYNAENMIGLELCAIFWHFLDFLWVYLFLFFLYIR